MDPASIIATALAAGILATADPSADPAVREAYELLEIRMRLKYGSVDLRPVASKPSSRAKRDSLAEDLQDAGAGNDEGLLEAALELLKLIHSLSPGTGPGIGVDLERVVVAALRSVDVDSEGTGVRIRDGDFEGEIEIGSVRAGGPPERERSDMDFDLVADPGQDAPGGFDFDLVEDTSGPAESRPAIFHGVPPRPAHLVGRDEILRALIERLMDGTEPSVAICGPGGVGKTALAAAIAHDRRVQERFRDGVLWASVGRDAKAQDILTAWGWPLGLQTASADVNHQAQLLRNAVGQRSILFVLDDVWDVEAARLLRCGGPNCAYLLATRDNALAREFAGPMDALRIGELDLRAVVELLRALAPEVLARVPDAAGLLFAASGGLPLAVELAARYLAEQGQGGLADFVRALLPALSDPAQLLKLAREHLGGTPGETATLEQIIARSLEDLPTDVVQAFYCLGAFAPHPRTFSRSAALEVANATSTQLEHLFRRTVVDSLDGERLSISPVVAEYARSRMPREAVVRHRAAYTDLLRSRADWWAVEREYPQIRHAWTHWNDDAKGKIRFALLAQDFQQLRGLWQDRMSWTEEALELVRRTGWEDDGAALLMARGEAHEDVGEWKEALEYYQRVLDFTNQALDRTGMAAALANIGRVHNALGRPQEAVESLQRALSTRYGFGDQRGIAVVLSTLGMVYQALGEWEQAQEALERALAIFEELGDRRRMAEALNRRGNVNYAQGRFADAQNQYDEALRIWQEVGDRRGEAATLNNMGSILASFRTLDIAITFFETALSIREEVGDRPGLAVTLVNLGLAYNAQEQREKAVEPFGRAVSLMEEIDDKQGLWLALTNLGLVRNALGQRQQAIEAYLHALPIGQELEDRERLAAMLNDLGAIYTELGEWDEALKHYRHALTIKEEGGDTAAMAITLRNLAALHRTLGRSREAEDYLDQARQSGPSAATEPAVA